MYCFVPDKSRVLVDQLAVQEKEFMLIADTALKEKRLLTMGG